MELVAFSVFVLCIAAQVSACLKTYNSPVLLSRDSPTSTDGNCGSNSDTNSTCLTSTFGNCCSPKGFCGSTTAYCGTGCQSDFGSCTNSNAQSISDSGSCGATSNSNLTCLGSEFGSCCSHLGYCGGNSSYCGTGCNSNFGNCGSVAITTPDIVSIPTASSTALLGTPSSASSASGNGTFLSFTPSSNSSSLSTGAKAGIAISAGAAAILAGLLIWFLLHNRRRRHQATKLPTTPEISSPFSPQGIPRTKFISQQVVETDSKSSIHEISEHKVEPHELVSQLPVYEMSSNKVNEDPVELAAAEDGWEGQKIKQERRRALVDDRVAAGYDGAYRGN